MSKGGQALGSSPALRKGCAACGCCEGRRASLLPALCLAGQELGPGTAMHGRNTEGLQDIPQHSSSRHGGLYGGDPSISPCSGCPHFCQVREVAQAVGWHGSGMAALGAAPPRSQHAYSHFYSPETLHSQCHGLAKVLALTRASSS